MIIFIVLLLFVHHTNSIQITINKPIVFVPGLGGSCIYDFNKNQLWPPNFNDIFSSNNKLQVNNLLESICTTSIPDHYNLNKNGADIDGIKIIKGKLTFLMKNRFGETLIKYFQEKDYPTYAFPYDFRIIPNILYLEKLYSSFTYSIEDIYCKNSNKKIIIIAHSLGSLLINNFFNTRPDEWNAKYIDKIIYINPPILGSILALQYILINTIIFFFTEINIKQIQNFGGLIWCLPKQKNILNIDDKDIENINSILPIDTLEVYKKYFSTKYTIFNSTNKIITHLILSDGIKTPSKLYLKKISNKYKFVKYDYINGDGIILPLDNNTIKSFNFVHKLIGDHSEILESINFFNKICEIVKY